MIWSEPIGKFPCANALYSGFGAFIPVSGIVGFTAPTPPTGGDDLGIVRVGIVRGGYVSDTPNIGGQF